MQENTSTKQQRQGLTTKAGENLMRTSALFDLTGRVAVVTGGNRGIGRSIALGLAEAGAAVAVFGRNDEKNQRVLSVQRALAGSFRHFVQTLRRQPRLRPTRVRCSGQSHDYRPSRQQLGRSDQIMRTFSSSSLRLSWSGPLFAALWMCFPACSFSFRLQRGANGLWSFRGHPEFANVSLPVEKRCGVRKETAQHRILQVFVQMFLRLVALIEEPQCRILE